MKAENTLKSIAAKAVLSAAISVVCALQSEADTFTVPEGTTYTVETSTTYGTNDIRGTLILPSGKTFGAERNWFGRTGNAVIDIRGGAYGTHPNGDNGISNEIVVGEEGGSASVALSGGGKLNGGYLTIKAATPANDDGYVDFLSSSGNNTVNLFERKSAASAPVRIRVLSGTFTDSAANIGYYTVRYQSGSWVFDVSEGAKVTFAHSYRAGALNSANVPVTVRGAGTARFTASNSNSSWPVSSGAVFDNAGGMECDGAFVGFGNGVVFGDSFGGITTSVDVKFGGDVNMGNLTATGSGSVKANGAATPTITFGTANRDATLTGAVFADGSGVSLVKTGTGTLTASATTPYLPQTTVNGGELVIKGALTCANLTLAAGTGVTVDGGVWTIEGAQLTQAAGSTISTANGGKIIVKTVGGSAPEFASGSTINVSEYWIDGVKQANGTYALGGVTLEVYSFVEPDVIWSNEGRPGAVHTFASNEEYKGFELVKSSAPLSFAGGPVALGSAGITVEDTADAATFGFDVPLFPPVDQTWAFGAASAVFSKPITTRGLEVGGLVTITSDADIVLATTNSTFQGSFNVTARSIVLSGSHPLGTGTATSSLKVDYHVGDAAKIVLRDVDLTQDLSLYLGSTSDRKYLVFEGENQLQGVNLNNDQTRGGSFAADSETVFNRNVTFYNYNCWFLGRNARVVFKAPVNFTGYAPSRSFQAAVDTADAGTPTLRFEAQNTVLDDGTYSASFGGTRIETAADHAFTQGWIKTGVATVIDLCGFDQTFSRVDGAGTVTSAVPAFLELSPAAGQVFTNRLAFAGKAGLKMVGAGTVRLDGNYASGGALAIESGCVELATTCVDAPTVNVSDGGCLVVEAAGAFGKEASLSLAGVGALANRSPSALKVGSLTLVNPSTGEAMTYRSGTFSAANSWGLVSEGIVIVGKSGMLLLVR